jgi:adenine-specific DNA-methyltransferase
VLDFFAGSGTTGHAVYDINAADSGDRRFVLVQLAETVPDGRYGTISALCRDRLVRAAKATADEAPLSAQSMDLGFRVLKVDSSNMKDVYYRPDEVTPALLGGHVDNIKDDRTDEDLLFQVLLDWGVDLSLPIAKEVVRGKPVYFVDTNALAACFAAGIDEAFVKELAARKPLRAVFRDAGYGSDDVKINVEQIFKQLSPGTEVKTL